MTGDTDVAPPQGAGPPLGSEGGPEGGGAAGPGWRGALLLLGIGGVLAFLLAEAFLRVFAPQNLEPHPPHLYAADDEIGFVLTPGLDGRSRNPEWDVAVTTNRLALREREIGPKAPGERRLLFLGDSFTFGLGVEAEEAFPRRVEALLGAGPPPLRVVNAGVPGYGTRHALAWWQRIDDAVDADALLLAFFLGNDFYDNVGLNEFEIVGGFRVPKRVHGGRAQLSARLGLPVRWKVALRTNLHTYALAMNGWAALLAWGGWTDLEEMYAVYRREPDPTMREATEATRQALARLAGRARAAGTPLGLVLIADTRVRPAIAARPDLDFERPARLVTSMAAELDLPVLDLSEPFSDTDGKIHPVDGHWNATGHALAAEAIARELRGGRLARVGAALGR
ncbi:MAG: SGNH/GDSL hydrolase family protein [Myxococcota bacterium]